MELALASCFTEKDLIKLLASFTYITRLNVPTVNLNGF